MSKVPSTESRSSTTGSQLPGMNGADSLAERWPSAKRSRAETGPRCPCGPSSATVPGATDAAASAEGTPGSGGTPGGHRGLPCSSLATTQRTCDGGASAQSGPKELAVRLPDWHERSARRWREHIVHHRGASQLAASGHAHGASQPLATSIPQPASDAIKQLVRDIQALGRIPLELKMPSDDAQTAERNLAIKLRRARKANKLSPEDEADLNNIGSALAIEVMFVPVESQGRGTPHRHILM